MVTNPPYGDGGGSLKGVQVPGALLHFVRHAIQLTEQADGQLALLVGSMARGQEGGEFDFVGPLAKVIVLPGAFAGSTWGR